MTAWAATAVNEGPQNFTDPGNAVGPPDGALATRAGRLLLPTTAALRLEHEGLPSEAESVAAVFHTRHTSAALGESTMWHEWRPDSGADWIVLAAYGGAVDFLDEPDVHELDVDDPSRVQLRVRCSLDVATTAHQVAVDAAGIDAVPAVPAGAAARRRRRRPRPDPHATAFLPVEVVLSATVRDATGQAHLALDADLAATGHAALRAWTPRTRALDDAEALELVALAGDFTDDEQAALLTVAADEADNAPRSPLAEHLAALLKGAP